MSTTLDEVFLEGSVKKINSLNDVNEIQEKEPEKLNNLYKVDFKYKFGIIFFIDKVKYYFSLRNLIGAI